VRKLPAVLTAAGLVAVALTGCSSTSPATCERDVTGDRLASLVTASGSIGDKPDVSVPSPFEAKGVEVADLVTGDGNTVVSDWQDIVLGITVVDGDTGDVLVQQGYSEPESVTTVSSWTQALPGLEDALMCATEGSRVVAALDADELGAAGDGLGVSSGGSAVFVMDLQKVYLAAADGADQFNSALGLPTVVRAPDGQPGIIIPDADAPEKNVVQVLKKGDGPKTTADDTIRINYTTVAWETREVSGTSWGAEPYEYPLSAHTDPLTKALIGQTVGSQLMIVLPPAEGQTGDTQVFVVDILGIDGQAG
jgi:peptidylprolyl isomerase